MTQVETRKYSLALLIILVLFCWPAAILYYFTRPKIITQQGYAPQPYPQQPPPQYQAPASRICTQCGRAVQENIRFCPNCGKQLN
ncbi:zinc ribbon domain-containing protein [Candidatus Bathyarchaeota archaeon]|nr:zinc ribbon domain-containing protein [Candidatus Bathyarchaeota archaeon]